MHHNGPRPPLYPKPSYNLSELSLKHSNLSLHPQPSRLDLIDNSTLTSLPFPPPLRTTKSKLKEYSSHKRRDSVLEDVTFTSIDTISNANMTTEIDESFEENEDPIILIEDYMIPPSSRESHNMHRKESLATFKQRIIPEPNGGFRSKRRISCDSLTETENMQTILGEIPRSNMLKYCDICDKPLYEISSIISNKRLKPCNYNNDTGTGTDNINMHVFNEFICFECIDTYEEFLTELYASENTQQRNELTNLKLLNMFKGIQLRSNLYSNKLVDRLKLLNSRSMIDEEMNWIMNLQNKLRWRWRLNGLLPFFKKPITKTQ